MPFVQVGFINLDGSVVADNIVVHAYSNDVNMTLIDTATTGQLPAPIGQGIAVFSQLQPGTTYRMQFVASDTTGYRIVPIPASAQVIVPVTVGPVGPTGATGPTGAQGIQGLQGSSGHGTTTTTASALLNVSSLTVTYKNSFFGPIGDAALQIPVVHTCIPGDLLLTVLTIDDDITNTIFVVNPKWTKITQAYDINYGTSVWIGYHVYQKNESILNGIPTFSPLYSTTGFSADYHGEVYVIQNYSLNFNTSTSITTGSPTNISLTPKSKGSLVFGATGIADSTVTFTSISGNFTTDNTLINNNFFSSINYSTSSVTTSTNPITGSIVLGNATGKTFINGLVEVFPSPTTTTLPVVDVIAFPAGSSVLVTDNTTTFVGQVSSISSSNLNINVNTVVSASQFDISKNAVVSFGSLAVQSNTTSNINKYNETPIINKLTSAAAQSVITSGNNSGITNFTSLNIGPNNNYLAIPFQTPTSPFTGNIFGLATLILKNFVIYSRPFILSKIPIYNSINSVPGYKLFDADFDTVGTATIKAPLPINQLCFAVLPINTFTFPITANGTHSFGYGDTTLPNCLTSNDGFVWSTAIISSNGTSIPNTQVPYNLTYYWNNTIQWTMNTPNPNDYDFNVYKFDGTTTTQLNTNLITNSSINSYRLSSYSVPTKSFVYVTSVNRVTGAESGPSEFITLDPYVGLTID